MLLLLLLLLMLLRMLCGAGWVRQAQVWHWRPKFWAVVVVLLLPVSVHRRKRRSYSKYSTSNGIRKYK